MLVFANSSEAKPLQSVQKARETTAVPSLKNRELSKKHLKSKLKSSNTEVDKLQKKCREINNVK